MRGIDRPSDREIDGKHDVEKVIVEKTTVTIL